MYTIFQENVKGNFDKNYIITEVEIKFTQIEDPHKIQYGMAEKF